MSEPYVYFAGDPDCAHDSVSESILTVGPPIHQWVCNNCKRQVRQTGEEVKSVMPVVRQDFDPKKYPYAKMKLEGDWLYRSDALHGEDEEVPDEFTITDDIYHAWKQHEWYRALYEVEMNLRYDLKTGTVELIGVEGVPLQRPVVMMN